MLPKMSGRARNFDETKCMYFSIKYDELLEKCNKIWNKVSNRNEKELGSEPVYNENYNKNYIKPYEGKINTIFNNYRMPKEGSHCICLSVILIDSVFKTDKNY